AGPRRVAAARGRPRREGARHERAAQRRRRDRWQRGEPVAPPALGVPVAQAALVLGELADPEPERRQSGRPTAPPRSGSAVSRGGRPRTAARRQRTSSSCSTPCDQPSKTRWWTNIARTCWTGRTQTSYSV